MRDLLRASLSSWRVRLAGAAVLVAALAAWLDRLTDHLSYASSLLCAVVCVPACAVASSALAQVARARGLRPESGAVLSLSAATAGVSVGAFALLALLRGAFGHECAPGEGAGFYALIPLPGALLAAFAGALLGASTRRAWVACLLALALLPATVVWSLIRFYDSPAIFAYDPFYGFFPGAIYDEVIPLSHTLVTYRLGTLGWILTAAGLFAWRWDASTARLARGGVRPALACAVGGALVGLGVYAAGPSLGHRASAREIEHELGMRLDGRRCSVVYARAIDAHQARLTRDDCDARVGQLEAFFGVRSPERITVFLFESSEQKQRLMGAAQTYIAKPWRHEVYLQYAPFPHPVLKHELAHVVAGAMAPGPFHVTTRYGIPLVGVIEGAAEAAGWDGDGANDVTPHQWSRAMLEAHMAPPARAIVGLGFYAYGSARAYTAAASFARFLIDRYGAARFAALYAHGDFERAYGRDPDALEREWHAFLRTVPVPERVLAIARARFRHAALTDRLCPHETAELFDRSQEQLAAGDVAGARPGLERVVRNDPTDVHAQAALVEAWARLGDVPRALAMADEASTTAGPAASARLRARVGDAVWRWRGADAARAIYAGVDPGLFDEDEARTVEVKRWALGLPDAGTRDATDARVALAVQDLLVGRGDVGADGNASSAQIGIALFDARGPSTGASVGEYLLGRALVARSRDVESAALLGRIDPALLPTERMRAETTRLRAVALYLAGDRAAARALFESLANDPARPLGSRGVARDWVDRIDRAGR